MTEVNTPNRRILLIDDNPSIHEDFRKILLPDDAENAIDEEAASFFGETPPRPSRTEFVLESAFQGEEALAKVKAAVASGQPFAVAFVDMRMPPGWDGLETIRRIWEVSPELETVICTAYSDHSWPEIQRTLGSSDRLLILKKPFDKIEVQQLALALTEKWNLRRLAALHTAGLEDLVRARTSEVVRANKSKSEFLASISHELLTPMNGILGNLELLALTSASEEQKSSIVDMRASSERLLKLIQGVLKFNTIESGRLTIQPRLFPVRQLCQSALEGVAAEASARMLKLEMSLHESVPAQLMGDAEQIQHVLSLLLENAVKFTSQGGIRVQVEPAGTSVRGYAFAVIDTGCGIKPDRLEVLKYPLSQIDSSLSRNAEGLGMGLTLARQLLHLMGGWLEFESKPGQGSTFRFTLIPQAQGEKAAA